MGEASPTDVSLYRLLNVTKVVNDGNRRRTILNDICLDIYPREFLGIVGESGAGKSSLLYSLGGLDSISEGKLLFEGKQITLKGSRQMAIFRRKIGFVFQSFQLIERYSVYDNIAMPLALVGLSEKAIHARVLRAVKDVNFNPRQLQQLPKTLSGGEKQRIAVARALINQPKVLLADEPTGSLDVTNRDIILSLLHEIHSKHGITVVMVSHSSEVIQRCSRVIQLRDGRVVTDTDLQPSPEPPRP